MMKKLISSKKQLRMLALEAIRWELDFLDLDSPIHSGDEYGDSEDDLDEDELDEEDEDYDDESATGRGARREHD